jgi:hypothetical protein
MPTGTREILEPRVPVSLWGPLTHGLSDQEKSNLDKTDREEHSVIADEYEGSKEG